MLLLVEKGIRGGIFHSIYRYAKANNKYMKDYHRNKTSSYLKYRDVSNLHGWAMSQKRPVNNFEWINDNSQFNGDFIKTIKKKAMKDINVQYPEKLHDLHNYLLFLPEKMKLEKVEKCVANLDDKTEYVIHIINLKQVRFILIKSCISFEKSS